MWLAMYIVGCKCQQLFYCTSARHSSRILKKGQQFIITMSYTALLRLLSTFFLAAPVLEEVLGTVLRTVARVV